MGVYVKSDMRPVVNSLKSLVKRIEQGVMGALEEIREVTTEAVTDNRNWNPKAVYKDGPQKGQKYDLNFTGSLLSTIRNANLNTIAKGEDGKLRLGIGHIPSLDALPTLRGDNPPGGYWRQVVYGRNVIHGYIFVTDGGTWSINPLKTKGWSIKQKGGTIDRSEPTYMFENGLRVASRSFPEILKRRIGEAIGK